MWSAEINSDNEMVHRRDELIDEFMCFVGTRRGAVGRSTALQAGRLRIRLEAMSLEFFFDIILWLWGRQSLRRN